MRSATKKRTGKNPQYLQFIRSLPCVCCCILSFPDRWLDTMLRDYMRGPHPIAVEAAHVGERGLSQKSNDLQTIPLCAAHHRTSKDSHHVLGKKFWSNWAIDRDELIAELQKRFYETTT